MSCTGLGQAAQVGTLIATDSQISGSIISPQYVIGSTGTQAAPVDLTGANPTIVAGTSNKVVLYCYNSTANTIDFKISTSTSGVRNHSYIVITGHNQVLGGVRPLATYCAYPATSSTGITTQFNLIFGAGALAATDAQQITVYILTDA